MQHNRLTRMQSFLNSAAQDVRFWPSAQALERQVCGDVWRLDSGGEYIRHHFAAQQYVQKQDNDGHICVGRSVVHLLLKSCACLQLCFQHSYVLME